MLLRLKQYKVMAVDEMPPSLLLALDYALRRQSVWLEAEQVFTSAPFNFPVLVRPAAEWGLLEIRETERGIRKRDGCDGWGPVCGLFQSWSL